MKGHVQGGPFIRRNKGGQLRQLPTCRSFVLTPVAIDKCRDRDVKDGGYAGEAAGTDPDSTAFVFPDQLDRNVEVHREIQLSHAGLPSKPGYLSPDLQVDVVHPLRFPAHSPPDTYRPKRTC